MIYVGIVAELLGIDRDEILNALGKQFKGKKKAIDANVAAIDKGIGYAKENLPRAEQMARRADERDRGQDHHRRQRRGGDRLRCSAASPS